MPRDATRTHRVGAHLANSRRPFGTQAAVRASASMVPAGERERQAVLAVVWLVPIVSGAIWPVLFAFRWHQFLLATLDGLALLAGVGAYVVVSRGSGHQRHTVVHGLLALLTACLTAVAALTGGLSSPKTIWLMLVPLAAVLWTGRRGASIWVTITAVILPLLPSLGAVLPAAPVTMPPDFYSLGLWLSLTTQLVLVASLLTANEESRARFWRSLTAKQAELNGELVARLDSERQLRLAEAKYRQLVEQVPAVVYATDLGPSHRDYVSPQIEAMLGYGAAEWVSAPDFWASRIHDDDRERILAEYSRCLETGQPCCQEYRLVALDGRVVWVRDECTFVRDESGTPVLVQGVMTDVSERRRLEERLARSHRMELVGRLAGGVAHHINNLLTVVAVNSSLALEDLRPGSNDGVRQGLTEVLQATDRARTLVAQLLSFSRRQTIDVRPIVVNEFVAAMGALVRPLLGDDIRFVAVPAPTPLSVQGDSGQLEQVILSLAENARDAMPDGGTLTVEAASVCLGPDSGRIASGLEPGEYVQLTVTDSGSGMSDEVRAHLFEPFFTTKEPGRGTGLGLASAYGIVRQHGGTIEVESELGRGTTVRLLLPRDTRGDSESTPDSGYVPATDDADQP